MIALLCNTISDLRQEQTASLAMFSRHRRSFDGPPVERSIIGICVVDIGTAPNRLTPCTLITGS